LGGNISFLAAGDSSVTSLSPAEFAAAFAGQVLRFKRAPVPAEEKDAAARPFGFSWFVPELLRHRRIWRDVLLASLVIQFLALGIPLFTRW